MESNPYQIAYQSAISDLTRQVFWKQQASFVQWFKFPTQILDGSNPPFYKWFSDGEINICHNAIDRHLKDIANQNALIWVSNMVNQQMKYTFRQLYENVCKMCILYKQYGIQKGDRVIIYMPMIPQAIFSVYACARLGAIHSIVFGGFSAKELSGRIIDSKPKLVVTASVGLQPNKIVNYVQILEQAIKISNVNPSVLIYQRPNYQKTIPTNWIPFQISQLQFHDVECEKMKSPDPLYILYTSGTTGLPKGIVRDQGGTTVALQWTMKHIMGINKGDVYFAASDIGWVVGHSFCIYGPLLRGATTIVYEGKPTTPNPGAYWKIFQTYKVNGFYTSPTGLRAIRKEDKDGQWIKKYDISSLRGVSMAGQRCDVPTYQWIRDHLKVLINDNYWQTQIGWIISCNYMNLHTFPAKPGSATKPCPGFDVKILDHQNKILPIKSLGKVCIKLPMPPSFMLTLYNNDTAFIEKYLEQAPGYYTTGDAGYFDQDGYLNIMTRLDDIINTAGHRLSTASMQEVLIKGGKVVQAAVVAKVEQLKGEVPVGFVVLKQGEKVQGIQKELIALIRKQIGPVASFQHVIVVDKLPKTRSGKILRNVLRKILEAQHYKIPPTIEDESVLTKIEEQVKKYGHGLGEKRKLVYRADLQINLKQDEQEELLKELEEQGNNPKKKVKTI